jgi:type I restriction enzyme S subunit
MNLKPYQNYKNSDIEWLGDIPEHWEIKRLKDVGNVRYGLGQPPKEKVGGLPIIRATNVERGKINENKLVFVDPEDVPYNRNPILLENDIVVVRSGAYTGDSAIIPKKYSGAITGYDMVFRPTNIHPKFIAFSLISEYIYEDQLVLASQRAAQPHLNKEELDSTISCIPPLPEQTKIANYLDQKTTAIDKKINLLKAKIKHYNALKKSLINETVCRGLNKAVPMKNSGVEWIGEIPKHWEVKRLKEMATVSTSSVNKKIEENEELIKLVNYTDVYKSVDKTIAESDDYMVVSANRKQIQSKNLLKGDVLFTPSSETIEDIGVSAVVTANLKNTLYSYHLIRCRFNRKKDINIDYKKYLFNTDIVQIYFSNRVKGTTRKIIGLADFNNLLIPISPKTEQVQIANYLDQKTGTINSIVTNLKTQIERLQELRKVLINAVVTGKVLIDN